MLCHGLCIVFFIPFFALFFLSYLSAIANNEVSIMEIERTNVALDASGAGVPVLTDVKFRVAFVSSCVGS